MIGSYSGAFSVGKRQTPFNSKAYVSPKSEELLNGQSKKLLPIFGFFWPKGLISKCLAKERKIRYS